MNAAKYSNLGMAREYQSMPLYRAGADRRKGWSRSQSSVIRHRIDRVPGRNFRSGMARLQAGAQSKATAIASILPATFWLACSSKRTR
jgi:hypothetical protein